jgi:hypothetical protein
MVFAQIRAASAGLWSEGKKATGSSSKSRKHKKRAEYSARFNQALEEIVIRLSKGHEGCSVHGHRPRFLQEP